MIWIILFLTLVFYVGYKLGQASKELRRILNKNPK
jgi:hypothetical protein